MEEEDDEEETEDDAVDDAVDDAEDDVVLAEDVEPPAPAVVAEGSLLHAAADMADMAEMESKKVNLRMGVSSRKERSQMK